METSLIKRSKCEFNSAVQMHLVTTSEQTKPTQANDRELNDREPRLGIIRSHISNMIVLC